MKPEAITGMTRTYTFVFDLEPEGGFTVTCPALPGLVTYGETFEEAWAVAHDVTDGLTEVMLEGGETIPGSDPPEPLPRFDRLAHTLRDDDEAEPIFEQLSARIGDKPHFRSGSGSRVTGFAPI
jgi:antitoxin HicB